MYAAFADRPGNNWDVNNIVTNEGLTTSKTQFDVVTYTGNGGTQKIGGPVYSAGATATGTNFLIQLQWLQRHLKRFEQGRRQ